MVRNHCYTFHVANGMCDHVPRQYLCNFACDNVCTSEVDLTVAMAEFERESAANGDYVYMLCCLCCFRAAH